MDNKKVVVIGGANIDICGQSYGPLIKDDSNPGFSKVSLGGVGRNIAHNLSLLGVKVSLVTALGQDENAKMIEKSCADLGIGLEDTLKVPDGRTSVYLFLNGPDGNMALAVSDMEICGSLTPQFLEQKTGLISQADVIVVDTNIPEDSIRWLAENCRQPLFVDPVSVTKSEKLRSCLGRIHTLKPNLLEAEYLSGIRIRNDEDLKRAADALLGAGLQRVFISMGSHGVFYADKKEAGTLPVLRTDVQNATGAGDAFMAGLVWSYLRGEDLRNSARFATAASSIAIEGAETINPAMSVEYLTAKAEGIA